jgi:hypothetical protein
MATTKGKASSKSAPKSPKKIASSKGTPGPGKGGQKFASSKGVGKNT